MRSVHRRIATLIVLGVVGPAAAQSAPGSPVAAGFARLYEGDVQGAYKHFEDLHQRDPDNLGAWYGLVFMLEARIDQESSLEPSFEREIDRLLDRADERYSRSRADADALFYLTQAYVLRGRYRFNRDKGIFGAARDAARAKGFADQYVKQHPEHGDAYLALGLYNYYVGIAPSFVKVLRLLLFLPAGDRAGGLKQLEQAAREGSVFAPLAESVLADVYGSFEGRVPDAIRVAERLQQRFPDNLDFRLKLGRLYAHPTIEAYGRAADQYTAVVARADAGGGAGRATARYRALLGLADLHRAQWRLEEAITTLTPTIDAQVVQPPWVLPNFLLARGNSRALLDDPHASDDARRVRADPKMAQWHKAAGNQLAFIEQRRKTDEAAVFLALIPGNRLAVERQWNDAKASYERVRAAHPDDWQVRYRLASLDFSRGAYDEAGRTLDTIVTGSARMPRWVKAAAILTLARMEDVRGRRDEAVKLYKRVVDEFEDQAAASGARVGLLTPYRPRTPSGTP